MLEHGEAERGKLPLSNSKMKVLWHSWILLCHGAVARTWRDISWMENIPPLLDFDGMNYLQSVEQDFFDVSVSELAFYPTNEPGTKDPMSVAPQVSSAPTIMRYELPTSMSTNAQSSLPSVSMAKSQSTVSPETAPRVSTSKDKGTKTTDVTSPTPTISSSMPIVSTHRNNSPVGVLNPVRAPMQSLVPSSSPKRFTAASRSPLKTSAPSLPPKRMPSTSPKKWSLHHQPKSQSQFKRGRRRYQRPRLYHQKRHRRKKANLTMTLLPNSAPIIGTLLHYRKSSIGESLVRMVLVYGKMF